jgi:hypothetical protein
MSKAKPFFFLFVLRRIRLGFSAKGLVMKPCPNSLKENLSRAISWTTRVFVVALKLIDSLAYISRTESALTANVLNHGLAGRSLSKTANCAWKVLAKPWVASTVFAAHSNETNLTRFVATNAIGM